MRTVKINFSLFDTRLGDSDTEAPLVTPREHCTQYAALDTMSTKTGASSTSSTDALRSAGVIGYEKKEKKTGCLKVVKTAAAKGGILKKIRERSPTPGPTGEERAAGEAEMRKADAAARGIPTGRVETVRVKSGETTTASSTPRSGASDVASDPYGSDMGDEDAPGPMTHASVAASMVTPPPRRRAQRLVDGEEAEVHSIMGSTVPSYRRPAAPRHVPAAEEPKRPFAKVLFPVKKSALKVTPPQAAGTTKADEVEVIAPSADEEEEGESSAPPAKGRGSIFGAPTAALAKPPARKTTTTAPTATPGGLFAAPTTTAAAGATATGAASFLGGSSCAFRGGAGSRGSGGGGAGGGGGGGAGSLFTGRGRSFTRGGGGGGGPSQLDADTNLQILNCSVRHLLTSQRARDHAETEAIWVPLVHNMALEYEQGHIIWKEDAKKHWGQAGGGECGGHKVWNISWTVDATSRIINDRGEGDISSRLSVSQMERLGDFFVHYGRYLDPNVLESQEPLSLEIAEAKLENKGARYTNGKQDGPERMLIKFKPVRRVFGRWSILAEVITMLSEEFCGGSRCGQQAALTSERVLYATGDMPDLTALEPARVRSGSTATASSDARAVNSSGLTGGRSSFRPRR